MDLVLKKLYNSTAVILTPTAFSEAGQPTDYSEETVEARESIDKKEFIDSTGKTTIANKKIFVNKPDRVSSDCKIRYGNETYSIVRSAPVFNHNNTLYAWALWIV